MGWKALAMELLAKSIGAKAGHKYIRREPRAGGGWRYWYETDKGKAFFLDLHHGEGKKKDKEAAEDDLKGIHALQKKKSSEKPELEGDKITSLWSALDRLSGRKRRFWKRRPDSLSEVVRKSRPVLGEELVAWIYALKDKDALQALYYGLLPLDSKKSGKSGGGGGGESKGEKGGKRFSRLAILALIRARLEALGVKVPLPERVGDVEFGVDPYKDKPLPNLRPEMKFFLQDVPWPEAEKGRKLKKDELRELRVALVQGLVELTDSGVRLTKRGMGSLLNALPRREREELERARRIALDPKKPEEEQKPKEKDDLEPQKPAPEPEEEEPEEEDLDDLDPEKTHKFIGSKYDPGRSLTATAKLVRAELKEAFKGIKFSVRSSSTSLSASISVTIKNSPGQVLNHARLDWDQGGKVLPEPGHPAFLRYTPEATALVEKIKGIVNQYNRSEVHVASDYNSSEFFTFVDFDGDITSAERTAHKKGAPARPWPKPTQDPPKKLKEPTEEEPASEPAGLAPDPNADSARIKVTFKPGEGLRVTGSEFKDRRSFHGLKKRHSLRWDRKEKYWYVEGSKEWSKEDGKKIHQIAADLRREGLPATSGKLLPADTKEIEGDPEKKATPKTPATKTHSGPVKDLQTLVSLLTFEGSAPATSGQQSGRKWAREKLAEDTRRDLMGGAAAMQRKAEKNRRLKPKKEEFWKGVEETARLARVAILADQGKLQDAREIGKDLGPATLAMIEKMEKLGKGKAVEAGAEFPEKSKGRFDAYIQNIVRHIELEQGRKVRKSDLARLTFPHVAPNEVVLLHEQGIFDADQLRAAIAGAYRLGKVEPESAEKKRERQAGGLRHVAARTLKAAQDQLSVQRLTNTARRASMAADIYERESERVALAHTMNSIADAISAGEADALRNVSTRADVEQLMEYVYRTTAGADGRGALRPLEARDIPNAKLPRGFGTGNASFVIEELRRSKKTRGVARDIQRVEKWISQTKEAGKSFAPTGREVHQSLRKLVGRALKNDSLFIKNSHRVDYFRRWERDNKRAEKMGITDDASLQSALRELLPHIGKSPEMEKGRAVKMKRDEFARQNIPDYFPTPKRVINKMLKSAGIKPGMTVLEPSAGTGHLADALKRRGGEVSVIEQNQGMRELLSEIGHSVVGEDALKHTKKYDRVIANPPFGKAGKLAIEHVKHSFQHQLKAGGRLVSIIPASLAHPDGGTRAHREFHQWVLDNGGRFRSLPEGAFKSSDRSTGVRTAVLLMEKPS